MIFLPVVGREMSVLARRSGSYWARSGTALASLIVTGWLLANYSANFIFGPGTKPLHGFIVAGSGLRHGCGDSCYRGLRKRRKARGNARVVVPDGPEGLRRHSWEVIGDIVGSHLCHACHFADDIARPADGRRYA